MKYVFYLAFFISTSAFSQNQKPPKFSKKIDSMLDSMLILFKESNSEQAFMILDKAIKLDSANIELYQLKLDWAHYLKKYSVALKTSLQMIEMMPDNPRLQFLTAIYYEGLGDSVNARPHHVKSIELYNRLLDTASAEQKECFSNPRFYLAIATVLSGDEKLGNKLLSDMYKECAGNGNTNDFYEKYLNKSRSELLAVWFSEK